ncbi:FAD-binding oxidoreductase [Streptomyces chromofuscus]|uniref:FAD-binding oxidoreductase n=1 Tax=Streptomyces chromofuscus TaxID=42881 RepID=UPI00167BB2A4|nr:FAD-dependent oxidoreductase [Streptomyces chromofuscus]GGT15893.1 FAD-binding protein [Streptomyces chromofuscus]
MNPALGTVPPEPAGKLVTPADSGYEQVRSTYTTVGRPAVVALPESPGEVAAALLMARDRGLPLAVRSGGHGLSGSATNNGGLVIDLRRMNGIEVLDRGNRLVRVEAGARWAQVAQALSPHGLAVSSGDHGNVGVGGLATGGGVGWLVRHFGLTIDRVRAVEVVLTDGSHVRADADDEPDLLWVMRGAGAGAGVAVAFEFEAVELRDVGVAQLVASVDPQGRVLRRLDSVLKEAPRELTTSLMLSSQGPMTSAFITAVVATDSRAAIRRALEPLLAIGDVTLQQAVVAPYASLVPPYHLHANTGQMPSTTTNGLMTDITPDAARAIVGAVSGPTPALFQMRSLGGAVADVDPSATAWAHRRQRFLVIASSFPPYGREALAEAWRPVAEHTDGAYVNFESVPDKASFDRTYPGPVGARVTALWKRYDPEGLLRGGG